MAKIFSVPHRAGSSPHFGRIRDPPPFFLALTPQVLVPSTLWFRGLRGIIFVVTVPAATAAATAVYTSPLADRRPSDTNRVR